MPTAGRYVVVLTGGVASGKSAAGAAFEHLGVPVHDADVAARAVVAPGSAALAEIVAAFGARTLDANGDLDRRALREHVFAHPPARAQLEGIVHPRVHDWLLERVAADRSPYSMLAIPLLVETWPQYAFVDRVAVVDVPEELQRARLMQRDRVDAALAERMLAAQATRAQRLALARDVIDNTGTLADLAARVATLHATYLAAARACSMQPLAT